jgi:hypothetical protein
VYLPLTVAVLPVTEALFDAAIVTFVPCAVIVGAS